MEFVESNCFLSIISSINVKSSPARFFKGDQCKIIIIIVIITIIIIIIVIFLFNPQSMIKNLCSPPLSVKSDLNLEHHVNENLSI